MNKKIEKIWGFLTYIPGKISSIFISWYFAILYRFHPNHKYHVLNTGRSPGYYDLDTRILYAVMTNFVEFYKHSPHSFFSRDCEWSKHPEILNADEFMINWFNAQRPIKDDLDKIYDWWVDRYLKITKEHEDYWDKYKETKEPYNHKAMFDLEEKLEEEANEMLQLLMKHRRCLWD